MEQLGLKANRFKHSKRGLAGCGTQTAALAFGGYISCILQVQDATEEYDGTTWATF
jgi:hypothetical protein